MNLTIVSYPLGFYLKILISMFSALSPEIDKTCNLFSMIFFKIYSQEISNRYSFKSINKSTNFKKFSLKAVLKSWIVPKSKCKEMNFINGRIKFIYLLNFKPNRREYISIGFIWYMFASSTNLQQLSHYLWKKQSWKILFFSEKHSDSNMKVLLLFNSL